MLLAPVRADYSVSAIGAPVRVAACLRPTSFTPHVTAQNGVKRGWSRQLDLHPTKCHCRRQARVVQRSMVHCRLRFLVDLATEPGLVLLLGYCQPGCAAVGLDGRHYGPVLLSVWHDAVDGPSDIWHVPVNRPRHLWAVCRGVRACDRRRRLHRVLRYAVASGTTCVCPTGYSAASGGACTPPAQVVVAVGGRLDAGLAGTYALSGFNVTAAGAPFPVYARTAPYWAWTPAGSVDVLLTYLPAPRNWALVTSAGALRFAFANASGQTIALPLGSTLSALAFNASDASAFSMPGTIVISAVASTSKHRWRMGGLLWVLMHASLPSLALLRHCF